MGVLFVKQLYAARGWTPAHVEMFLRIYCGEQGLRGGYTTYESAGNVKGGKGRNKQVVGLSSYLFNLHVHLIVHGLSAVHVLREIRKVSGLPSLPRTGPKLKFHNRATYDKKLGMYHVPFMFADPSVVRLSQQLFLAGAAEPPKKTTEPMPPTVQFAGYLLLPSLWILILYHIYGLIFSFLAASPWGRNTLLNHPERFSHGVFSKTDPTEQQLRETSFEMILRSKGYESAVLPSDEQQTNASLNVVIRGPEMGYVTTPRIVLQSALALLQEKSNGKVPFGVMTPSVAFWNTDLLDRLQSVGITFEEQQ